MSDDIYKTLKYNTVIKRDEDRVFLAGNRFGKNAMTFNEMMYKLGIEMTFSEYMNIIHRVNEEEEI